MEVVGVAGLVALGAILGGFSVYAVMRRHMKRARVEASHKIATLNAAVRQLTRMANSRRTATIKKAS